VHVRWKCAARAELFEEADRLGCAAAAAAAARVLQGRQRAAADAVASAARRADAAEFGSALAVARLVRFKLILVLTHITTIRHHLILR
jgi:hypothetical protein